MEAQRKHVIAGEPDMVFAALCRAREQGRLVEVTGGRVLPGRRVELVAYLREPTRVRSRWERVRPWLVGAGKVVAVLAVLAALAGLVWLIWMAVLSLIALVTAILAWVQAHLVVIVLGTVALLVLLLAGMSSGGGCAGLHCGGCRG